MNGVLPPGVRLRRREVVGDVTDGISNGLGPVMLECWGRCSGGCCDAKWHPLFVDTNRCDGILGGGGRGLSRAGLESGVFG
jgi:hypothetical protein